MRKQYFSWINQIDESENFFYKKDRILNIISLRSFDMRKYIILCIFVYVLVVELNGNELEHDQIDEENSQKVQISSLNDEYHIMNDILIITEKLKNNSHLKSNDLNVVNLINQLDSYSKKGVAEASYLLGKYYLGGILPFTLSSDPSLLKSLTHNHGFGFIKIKEINSVYDTNDKKSNYAFNKDDWLLDLSYRITEDYSDDKGFKAYDYLYNSPLDIQKAIYYLIKAAQEGHTQSISLLSVLANISIRIPPPNIERYLNERNELPYENIKNDSTISNYYELYPVSRIWSEMASTSKIPSSNILQAYSYAIGSNTYKENCLRSVESYEIAADAYFNFKEETPPSPKISFGDDSIDLEHKHGVESSKTHTDIVEFIKYHADVGEKNFQKTAGLIYVLGAQGIARDYKKAFEYLKACYENDPAAKGLLAYMYQNGLGVDVDYPTAIRLYNESANDGNGFSSLQLGLMYLRGWYLEKNPNLALQYFSKGSDMIPERFTYAAEIFMDKQYGNVDYNKAKLILLNAKNLHYSHPRLLYYLAKIDRMGTCKSRLDIYKELMTETYFKPIQRRAYHYFSENKFEHALLLYDILASFGDVLSQKNAGWMYSKGLGNYKLKLSYFFPDSEGIDEVIDGQKQSIALYKMAARQNSAEANLKLGDIYYYGIGVEKDLKKAAAFYWIATDLKNARAAFNFGYMYQKGEGVPMNFALAKRHYDLAMSYSNDAYIPCKLALISLFIESKFEIIKDFTALFSTISLLITVIILRKYYDS